ncbi:hypothetical protein HS041_12460 [Planomonospora sp. ID67723]|uniref:hypothetical protein n=1 Tax=Planomonospora sp. ID67723 TaxID=2738134 RepID=UPI0018C35340|nr:hypothetical protein [Planomonospora sp. ID67723]MBG0828582.1 hypothetical protein [Planomonospora sp. ID67723]
MWRTRAERQADAARARAVAERASIEAQRARDQREMEHLEAEREMLKVRAELDAERGRLADQESDKRKAKSRLLRSRISLAVVLATANVGVNATAVLGQVLALVYGQHWSWWAAAPVAIVVESVAVNVGYFAHDKLIKGYNAFWLRLMSYGIGAGVGLFNYTHNKGLTETGEFAGVFGVASLLSPVLWQIYSQWRRWEDMRAQGLLEERTLHFPLLRWVIPSLRAETWEAFKYGVAEGIRSPEAALAEVRARNATGNARDLIRETQQALIDTQQDALRLALTHLAWVYDDLDGADPVGRAARERVEQITKRFQPFIPPFVPGSLVADPTPAGGNETGTDPEPKKPSEQDNSDARDRVRDVIRNRRVVPTKTAIAGEFGFSESWGYDRVKDVKDELSAKGWTFLKDGSAVPPPRSRRGSGTVPANGADLRAN